MKKISIILISVLLFSSCIRDYTTMTKFIIENNYEYELKIEVKRFDTEIGAQVDTIFTIGSGSKISHKYSERGEDAVSNYPFGIYSDSIIIYFNDTVSRLFSKYEESQYNPLKIENYSGGKVRKGRYTFTYTITNQDFQEALKD